MPSNETSMATAARQKQTFWREHWPAHFCRTIKPMPQKKMRACYLFGVGLEFGIQWFQEHTSSDVSEQWAESVGLGLLD